MTAYRVAGEDTPPTPPFPVGTLLRPKAYITSVVADDGWGWESLSLLSCYVFLGVEWRSFYEYRVILLGPDGLKKPVAHDRSIQKWWLKFEKAKL